MITVLADALWTELLRYAYALSTARGPERLAGVMVAALVVGVVLVGRRVRASGPPMIDGGTARRRRLPTAPADLTAPSSGDTVAARSRW